MKKRGFLAVVLLVLVIGLCAGSVSGSNRVLCTGGGSVGPGGTIASCTVRAGNNIVDVATDDVVTYNFGSLTIPNGVTLNFVNSKAKIKTGNGGEGGAGGGSYHWSGEGGNGAKGGSMFYKAENGQTGAGGHHNGQSNPDRGRNGAGGGGVSGNPGANIVIEVRAEYGAGDDAGLLTVNGVLSADGTSDTADGDNGGKDDNNIGDCSSDGSDGDCGSGGGGGAGGTGGGKLDITVKTITGQGKITVRGANGGEGGQGGGDDDFWDYGEDGGGGGGGGGGQGGTIKMIIVDDLTGNDVRWENYDPEEENNPYNISAGEGGAGGDKGRGGRYSKGKTGNNGKKGVDGGVSDITVDLGEAFFFPDSCNDGLDDDMNNYGINDDNRITCEEACEAVSIRRTGQNDNARNYIRNDILQDERDFSAFDGSDTCCGDDVFYDGDFEFGGNSWKIRDENFVEIERSDPAGDDPCKSGVYCAHFKDLENMGANTWQWVRQVIRASPGTEYAAAAWLKAKDGAEVCLIVKDLNVDKELIPLGNSHVWHGQCSNLNGWKRVVVGPYTTHDDTRYLRISGDVGSGNGLDDGEAWIDGVEVYSTDYGYIAKDTSGRKNKYMCYSPDKQTRWEWLGADLNSFRIYQLKIDLNEYSPDPSDYPDRDRDGHSTLTDCDDDDAEVHPGADWHNDGPSENHGWDYNCNNRVDFQAEEISRGECYNVGDDGELEEGRWYKLTPRDEVRAVTASMLIPQDGWIGNIRVFDDDDCYEGEGSNAIIGQDNFRDPYRR